MHDVCQKIFFLSIFLSYNKVGHCLDNYIAFTYWQSMYVLHILHHIFPTAPEIVREIIRRDSSQFYMLISYI
jgi:hypothetical protein